MTIETLNRSVQVRVLQGSLETETLLEDGVFFITKDVIEMNSPI